MVLTKCRLWIFSDIIKDRLQNMARDCLACGAKVEELFAPCPICGTRATDPNIRRGESKAAYERSQGRANFVSQLDRRGTAARNLQRDILTEVPVLSGSESYADSVATDHHHNDLIRRHGGGVPEGGRQRKMSPFWYVYLIIFCTFGVAIPVLEIIWDIGVRYFSD